jgi:hypothetical protein
MGKFKDYYALLGVSPSAELVVIRAAYRALALKYHPDTWTGEPSLAERFMRELNEAYQVLSNEESRQKYDELRQRHGARDYKEEADQAKADPASAESESSEAKNADSAPRQYPINWSKGFFRAWIVLSIPYAIIVACLNYGEAKYIWTPTFPKFTVSGFGEEYLVDSSKDSSQIYRELTDTVKKAARGKGAGNRGRSAPQMVPAAQEGTQQPVAAKPSASEWDAFPLAGGRPAANPRFVDGADPREAPSSPAVGAAEINDVIRTTDDIFNAVNIQISEIRDQKKRDGYTAAAAAFAVALAPPIFILMVGWLFRWILRGFSRINDGVRSGR